MHDAARLPTVVVDAMGLLCPLPVLRMSSALRRLDVGGTLELLSDDPRILRDLPAWCEGNGQVLVALEANPAPAPGEAATAWRGTVRRVR